MKKIVLTSILTAFSITNFAQEQKISFEEEEGFNNNNYLDGQNGWIAYGDNSNTKVDLSRRKASDGIQSVVFSYYSTSSSTEGKWNGVLYKLPEYKHFSISVDVNATAWNRSDYNFLKLTNIQGFTYNTVGKVTFLSTGKIDIGNVSTNNQWQPTMWYNLKCEVNLYTREVKYYANDQFLFNRPITSSSITKIDEVSFETNNKSHGMDYEFYFDNLVIKNLDNLDTENVTKESIKIYPNPVQDELNIQTNNLVKQIEIFDLTGKKVLTSKSKNINIQHLSKGTYLVKVITDKEELTQKVIKK